MATHLQPPWESHASKFLKSPYPTHYCSTHFYLRRRHLCLSSRWETLGCVRPSVVIPWWHPLQRRRLRVNKLPLRSGFGSSPLLYWVTPSHVLPFWAKYHHWLQLWYCKTNSKYSPLEVSPKKQQEQNKGESKAQGAEFWCLENLIKCHLGARTTLSTLMSSYAFYTLHYPTVQVKSNEIYRLHLAHRPKPLGLKGTAVPLLLSRVVLLHIPCQEPCYSSDGYLCFGCLICPCSTPRRSGWPANSNETPYGHKSATWWSSPLGDK